MDTEKCPEVSWNADKHEPLGVHMILSFIQKDNTTKTITMPVRNENFRNCDYTSNAIAVQLTTNVYIKNNGLWIKGKNQTVGQNITIFKVQKVFKAVHNKFFLSLLQFILCCGFIAVSILVNLVMCKSYFSKSKFVVS